MDIHKIHSFFNKIFYFDGEGNPIMPGDLIMSKSRLEQLRAENYVFNIIKPYNDFCSIILYRLTHSMKIIEYFRENDTDINMYFHSFMDESYKIDRAQESFLKNSLIHYMKISDSEFEKIKLECPLDKIDEFLKNIKIKNLSNIKYKGDLFYVDLKDTIFYKVMKKFQKGARQRWRWFYKTKQIPQILYTINEKTDLSAEEVHEFGSLVLDQFYEKKIIKSNIRNLEIYCKRPWSEHKEYFFKFKRETRYF